MPQQTTSPFISAAAAGGDWRAAARAALAQLEPHKAALKDCTIGFIYMTDVLAEDAAHILELVRGVTGIKHWIGSVGVGVCAPGVSYMDVPAIALMAGALDPELFRVFPAVDLDLSPALAALDPWLAQHDPMLVLLHGDPLSDNDPAHTLAELAQAVGGFMAGGLASARAAHIQVADGVVEGGLSGAAFAAEVEVATALSQGCVPMGPPRAITRGADNMVMELDGRPAFDVLRAELRDLAAAGGPGVTVEEGGTLNIGGAVHVAFPVPGRDQRDYLVRHALGLDPDEGWIAVAYPVQEGAPMMFVHRDDATVRADLARALLDLRARVTRQKGVFAPRGALYISCVARAAARFAENGPPGGEMALVREILGDIPLAGFYANGEIANATLYGHAAVVILFL
jgi:small ligand-binding sensory domain FIST